MEFGEGLKLEPTPSNPKAAGGGVRYWAAVSYWPMRLLPCGVIARAVTMYTGATLRPWFWAVVQSAHPSALADASLAFAESQQTGELAVPESTGASGKVPFCFCVTRTHLYFREEVVLV